VGFGAGIFLTATLSLLVPPKFALAAMAVLQIAFDVISGSYYWGRWERRLITLMVPFTLVGVWLGSYLVAALPAFWVRKIVGLSLVLYAGIQLVRQWRTQGRLPLRPKLLAGGVVAATSGMASSLANVSGVILAIYLQALELPQAEFIGTMTAVQVAQDVFKLYAYWQVGLLGLAEVKFSLPFVPLIFLGGWLGALISPWVSPALFGRLVLLFVLASGVRLLV